MHRRLITPPRLQPWLLILFIAWLAYLAAALAWLGRLDALFSLLCR